jgi:hemolysin activation/secretion protein
LALALRRVIFVGLLLSGGAVPALAQDAGSLLREQQRREELQRLERLPEAEAAQPAEPRIVGPEKGETIVLKDLRFTGKVEILPETEGARIAAEVRGRRLGIAGIEAIADEVTIAIQKSGRLLGYAVLPPQDITEGVVTVQIVEGALEDIEFKRQSGVRIREALLDRIAQAGIRADNVEEKDLEAALLRMNDLPGVTARARLMPGSTPHSSKLVVGVEQTPVLSASLWGNNFGDYSTGKAQGNASVNVTDLSGYGDLTQLTGTFSEGQKFGQAAFSIPLGASDFAINADYAYLDYRNIDDFGSFLGLEGTAQYAGTGLDYSLIRSRNLNLWLSGELNWKALVDESIVGRLQDKRSLSGTFAINGDARDPFLGGGLTSWSLGWTFGDLDLSRVDSAAEADLAGLKTQGSFNRLNLQAARLQKLPGDFSLFGRFYGQWASKNLDSSEEFALGGPYGVRGWPVGEGRGDSGFIGTVELRYDAPVRPDWGQLQIATYLDAGRIWVNTDPNGVVPLNACGCNDFALASAGLSASWTRENMSFSVSWAHALGDNPGRSIITGKNADGTARNQQFWLQGSISF